MKAARTCWILVSLLACGSAAAQSAVDPRLRVDEQVRVFWVDNERVLFRGFTREDVARMDNGSLTLKELFQGDRVIRTFNIRTREIKDIAARASGGLCFGNGNVLYATRRENDKTRQYVFGPLDGTQTEVERTGISSSIRCYNPDVSRFPPWPSKIIPLREDHGFVELRYKNTERGIRGDEAEIFLYPKGREAGVLIPGYKAVHAQNLANGNAHFVAWKGAYFNHTPGVGDTFPNSAWWLYPDGKTAKLRIPHGPWSESSRTNAGFSPMKCGLLIDVRQGMGELVLLSGDLTREAQSTFGKVEKIVSGPVWRLDTSPDGLRVALVIGATRSPSTNPSNLVVLEICRT